MLMPKSLIIISIWSFVAITNGLAKKAKHNHSSSTKEDHISRLLESSNDTSSREHAENEFVKPRVQKFNIKKAWAEKDEIVASGSAMVLYAEMSKQDILDLKQIQIVIRNPHHHRNDGLHFLQISASNGRETVTFSLPDSTRNGTSIMNGGRLLKPLQPEDFKQAAKQVFTLTVQTLLNKNVSFNYRVRTYDRSQYYVQLPSGQAKFLPNQHVNHDEPLAYRLNTSGAEVLRIHFSSADAICARLIMTNENQSVYSSLVDEGDDLRSLSFSNRLDMLLLGSQVHEILNLFVFVSDNDIECDPNSKERTLDKLKRINVTISSEPDISYYKPVTLFLSVFLLLPAALLIYAICSRKHSFVRSSSHQHVLNSGEETRAEDSPTTDLSSSIPPLIILDESLGTPNETDQLNSIETAPTRTIDLVTNEASNAEDSPRELVAAYNANDMVSIIYSISSSNSSAAKNSFVQTRFWQIGEWKWTEYQFVFFMLPVLVQSAIEFYGKSGLADDSCFLNYACIRPYGNLRPFNHIISNSGYLINALLYFVFIYLRKNKGSISFGAIPNVSLEVCMAFALFGESIASAIYHICPSQSSYHFDTPFIQVLCVLMMLKLYGSRHGRISSRTTHIIIASVVAVDVGITILDRHPALRFILVIFHLLCVIKCLYYINGASSMKDVLWHPNILSWSVNAIIFLVNFILSVVFLLNIRFLQTAQLVTFFCIINLFIYMVYYNIMKWRLGEPRCCFSLCSLIISILLWSSALYFFMNEETNWALTPAQSRNLNSNCVLMSFYDSHDIWHLLSAQAALASLVAVSSIDDAVATRPTAHLTLF